jgi:hypothetical protein
MYNEYRKASPVPATGRNTMHCFTEVTVLLTEAKLRVTNFSGSLTLLATVLCCDTPSASKTNQVAKVLASQLHK